MSKSFKKFRDDEWDDESFTKKEKMKLRQNQRRVKETEKTAHLEPDDQD
jgi:hypothetical protein